MPKNEYEEMIKMNKDDFLKKYAEDGDDYVGLYDITEELYGLGKYVDYSEGMEKVIFDDKWLMEKYSEYSFHKLDKEIIKDIINEYSDNVANYYKGLLDGVSTARLWGIELGKIEKTQEERIYDIEKHLVNRVRQFTNKEIFEIENGPITNSWEYEYAIFELIRIYREFNEDEDVLLYYGY